MVNYLQLNFQDKNLIKTQQNRYFKYKYLQYVRIFN